jgi:hypothetical protein
MHQNANFNILQAAGNCKAEFVVIKGQRTASGNMAMGAKVLTGAMSRDAAITMADQMEGYDKGFNDCRQGGEPMPDASPAYVRGWFDGLDYCAGCSDAYNFH